MKITVSQQDLSRGLSIVNHAVTSKGTLPILEHVLLTTDQGCLKLAATNLEIGITCWVDAEVLEDGETTLQAKLFTELVNSLAQGQVDLCVPADSTTVNIKSPGSNANMKGVEASEFPLIPSAEGGEPAIVLDAALLKEVISQVVFAAATDDSRPAFTGILVEISEGQVTFAAADSFRLALRVAALPDSRETYSPILIPAKTLKELARILPDEGAVEMIILTNRSQVFFHIEQMDLVSRLIGETFPNVRAAIPKNTTTRAIVNTKEFAAAVKRVTPFASANSVRVNVTNGAVTLESEADDLGDNVCTIEARIEGETQSITLNAKYLSDVLSVIQIDEVALELTTATQPGVIKPVGDIDYVYIIMPLTKR